MSAVPDTSNGQFLHPVLLAVVAWKKIWKKKAKTKYIEKKLVSLSFHHFKFSKTRSFPSKSYRSAALFHHLIKVFYLFRVWWRKGARNDSATGAAWKHISCPAALKQVNLCNHAATHHEKSPVKKFKKKKMSSNFP